MQHPDIGGCEYSLNRGVVELCSASGGMVLPGKGLISDQTIEFTDALTAKKCPILLRRIGYRDPETDKHYIFLTNNSLLLPVTVASFTFDHLRL